MTQADFLTREEVRGAYQKNAKFYDLAFFLYYLIGIRIGRWRRCGKRCPYFCLKSEWVGGP